MGVVTERNVAPYGVTSPSGVTCLETESGRMRICAQMVGTSKELTRVSLRTYLISPCSTVLLEKLTVPQLVKKLPAFYGT